MFDIHVAAQLFQAVRVSLDSPTVHAFSAQFLKRNGENFWGKSYSGKRYPTQKAVADAITHCTRHGLIQVHPTTSLDIHYKLTLKGAELFLCWEKEGVEGFNMSGLIKTVDQEKFYEQ